MPKLILPEVTNDTNVQNDVRLSNVSAKVPSIGETQKPLVLLCET